MPDGWLPATVAVGVVAAAIVGMVPMASVGTSLLLVAIAAALFFTKSVTTRMSRWSLLAAVGFALLLMVRTDPRLVTFNLMATGLFLLIAVIGPERLLDWRPLELLNDACSIAIQPFLLTGIALRPSVGAPFDPRPDRTARRQLALGILQGAVIAIPLVIVLAALLGSADAVFAELLSNGQFDASALWYAALRFSVGAIAVLVLIGRTTRSRSHVLPAGFDLDRTPTMVVLAALNAIFALFVAAQLYALTGAGEQILTEAGLTYSDYARQGFFQLLWVSGLTMIVLLSLRSASSAWSRSDRWFRWSSLAAVVLTIGVVVVALGRLQLYIADFGLTPLRFYSTVFSVWVAFGFVLVAARLVGWRAETAWTMPALVASGLVVLIGLNVANPEARIAVDLVDRTDIGSAVDQLTGDGQSVIAERLDDMAPSTALDATQSLCENVPDDDDWLSWNLGRSRARSALLELC